MKQAGYEVQTSADGDDALQQIHATPPDLVLLDINMPKRNGYEVCETVRADPKLSSVKIIMLTAKGRDVEREKGLALGADDYVVKPFSTQDVVDKVSNILSGD